MKHAKLHHKTLEKNLKAVVYQESIDFLKEKSKAVTDMITRNHRRLVVELISIRKQAVSKLEEL